MEKNSASEQENVPKPAVDALINPPTVNASDRDVSRNIPNLLEELYSANVPGFAQPWISIEPSEAGYEPWEGRLIECDVRYLILECPDPRGVPPEKITVYAQFVKAGSIKILDER